jgi:hypothetical protein
LERFEKWLSGIADRDYFEAPRGADARPAVKRSREALAEFEALALASDSEDDGPMGQLDLKWWKATDDRPSVGGRSRERHRCRALMWLLLVIAVAVGRPQGEFAKRVDATPARPFYGCCAASSLTEPASGCVHTAGSAAGLPGDADRPDSRFHPVVGYADDAIIVRGHEKVPTGGQVAVPGGGQ